MTEFGSYAIGESEVQGGESDALFSLNNRGHRLLSLFGSIAFGSRNPEKILGLLTVGGTEVTDSEENEDYEESDDYGDDYGSETDKRSKKSDESGESEDSVDSENYDEFMHYLFLMIP